SYPTSVSTHFLYSLFFFFFTAPPTTEIYTLSLHDALPISGHRVLLSAVGELCVHLVQHLRVLVHLLENEIEQLLQLHVFRGGARSEEHTSELQSPCNLVCRLLLEKKKQQ